MLDGKTKKYSGGNVQRESFGKKEGGSAKVKEGGSDRTDPKVAGEHKGSGKTTITHNEDGSHSVDHADGEHSDHPSMGHLATHMAGKHDPGMHMHAHGHESGVTTHHVGHDGMVEGPHEHGSPEEAGGHMAQVLGQDGGNGAMRMSSGADMMGGAGGGASPHGPSLY